MDECDYCDAPIRKDQNGTCAACKADEMALVARAVETMKSQK